MTAIAKSAMTKSLVNIMVIAAIGAGLSVPAQAQTGATAADYVVRKTSDVRIKMGISAFKDGDYERAASYNLKALKAGLSKSRKAIAYNNLCAALGAQGDYAGAVEACDSALELRPDLKEAAQNRAAVQAQLSSQ